MATRQSEADAGEGVISTMLKILREWLRKSPHFHLRERPAETIPQLIGLFDRFLDGKMNYELEWDDFISWENSNPNIELIRERIAEAEPLFFSKKMSDRKNAFDLLVEERNRAAAIIGLSARSYTFRGRTDLRGRYIG